MKSRPGRQILAWSCYDWANSAFATAVIAGFFPVFFKEFWAAGLPVTESTRWLGYASSAASLVLVCTAPLLGALADQLGAKKRFLLLFTTLGVFATGGLFWLAAGHWVAALALYAMGLIGFLGGNVFYDSLITDVAEPGDYERVSSLGYALGYLGGGLLFALNVAWSVFPPPSVSPMRVPRCRPPSWGSRSGGRSSHSRSRSWSRSRGGSMRRPSGWPCAAP